jgi:hypothetical protein
MIKNMFQFYRMNSYYFTTLFLILVVIAISFTVNKKEETKKEAFENATIFTQPESPVAQKNLVDELKPYTYPSDTLLSPSPGQVASFNSLPYTDPSLEKAKYERILNVQTTLQGFLTNEASSLADLSDPAIVLPLTTARSDLTRLRNEVLVLKRNPGIDSNLTQQDVDEIDANLAYLQTKWRQSIYNDINNIEGFNVEGFDVTSDRASLNELKNIITRIDTTTTLLSSSATTDPVFRARIEALKNVRTQIQSIVNEVESGARMEAEIPITRSAYEQFLKTVSNTNSPITNLMKNSNLPTTLSDLFPAYSYGDVSGANLVKYLFNQYAETLFKGLSWDINLRYTSESEQKLANSIANSIGMSLASSKISTQGTPSSINTTPLNQIIDNRGEFASTVTNLQAQTLNKETTNQTTTNQTTTNKSTAPTKFDWHERSNFICDAIKKRGLNPDDFGCLKPDQYVSENFSWRGYSKMICNRLGTSYDTGLPETCGCPPTTWKGWRV